MLPSLIIPDLQKFQNIDDWSAFSLRPLRGADPRRLRAPCHRRYNVRRDRKRDRRGELQLPLPFGCALSVHRLPVVARRRRSSSLSSSCSGWRSDSPARIPVLQTLYGACSRLRRTPLKLRKSLGVRVRKLANSYGTSPSKENKIDSRPAGAKDRASSYEPLWLLSSCHAQTRSKHRAAFAASAQNPRNGNGGFEL
jgi:hypothetical protein